LSEELKERGLSQEAAARRIGVSLKTVSRWVRGETEPRFRELALIQRAFGEQPISLPARSSDQS
jgi:transcriptional regulator with XRE-family HTH domain